MKPYLLILIFAFSVLDLTATQDSGKANSLDGLRSAFSLKKTEHLSCYSLINPF